MSAGSERGRDPLLGAVLDGRYEILAGIGEGGMARVYAARQTSVIGRDVAVKVLTTSSLRSDVVVKRFENEARIIAQLRHPNTLKLIDSGRLADGRLYVVTELLHGESLDDVIARGPLGAQRTREVLRGVVGSLAEAHEVGIIHRDLKPGNVFVEKVGGQEIVRVLDFGIAKIVSSPGLTAPMQIFGTPAYMSPEQVRGQVVDPRADLYALGVLAYECLTGRPLFEADTNVALMGKHLMEAPPPLPRASAGEPIDATLAALVMRLLAKDPNARPSSAHEVRRILDERPTASSIAAAPGESRDERPSLSAALGDATRFEPTDTVPSAAPEDEPTTPEARRPGSEELPTVVAAPSSRGPSAVADRPAPPPSPPHSSHLREWALAAFTVVLVGVALWLYQSSVPPAVERSSVENPLPTRTVPSAVAVPRPIQGTSAVGSEESTTPQPAKRSRPLEARATNGAARTIRTATAARPLPSKKGRGEEPPPGFFDPQLSPNR